MPADAPAHGRRGLMGRAKEDLAELVAFQSVADPKQYPPEECEKAAQWVVDAFAEVGLQDVTLSPTPDGTQCVHGHAPGPEGAPTVLLYCHYDVQPPLGRGGLGDAAVRADRARRPLVRPRRRRLQGQHRHAPHRAARARATAAPGRRQADRARARRSRAPAAWRRSSRATPTCCAPTRSWSCDTGNFAVGVPTLTTTLRGMANVVVTVQRARQRDALGHVRRRRRPTRWRRWSRCSPSLRDDARQHDDRRAATTTQTLDAASTTPPSSSAPTPACSTAWTLIGDGTRRRHALGAAGGHRARASTARRWSARRPRSRPRRAPASACGVPPGIDRPQAAQDALVAHLRGRGPVGRCRCEIERVAIGDPFVGSHRRPGVRRR